MRNKKIVAYYTPKQVLEDNIQLSTSKSPLKPKLVMSALMKVANEYIHIQPKFKPFTRDICEIAHSKYWVDTVFDFNKPGVKLASSIPWSEQLVTSLTYTSSSLYHAIKHSINKPEDVVFSPTSGFHHARPHAGMGFCTFAGQVIASTKIYRETGKVGCYLDLDGHYGNSIEDCRSFVGEDLNKAVPKKFNYNTSSTGKLYVKELFHYLYDVLQPAMIKGDVDYVVWCHGADSHQDDDLGHQVNTEEWVQCSKIFWTWVKNMDKVMGKPISVSCALFGGYRSDDYQSVIDLHVSDFVNGLNILHDDANINFELNYKSRRNERVFY